MGASKPSATQLAVLHGGTVDQLPWRTSGDGAGMFEVAIVNLTEQETIELGLDTDDADLGTWVLVRLTGAPDIQVYSRFEWKVFCDGVQRGEFDDLV